MLELVEVEGFSDILIHVGNSDDDTAGCVLLGDSQRQNVTKGGFIGYSSDAYERVYRFVIQAMLNGVDVYLII